MKYLILVATFILTFGTAVQANDLQKFLNMPPEQQNEILGNIANAVDAYNAGDNDAAIQAGGRAAVAADVDPNRVQQDMNDIRGAINNPDPAN